MNDFQAILDSRAIRLLFVDDDPLILAAYKRLLRRFDENWEPEFSLNGPEALVRLAERPFDAVITDLQMPGMDGAELLSEVERRHPSTIRIMLTGQSSRASVYRTLGPANHFIDKPFECETLREALSRACNLRGRLDDSRLRSMIAQVSTLPSLPHLFRQLTDALGAEDASIEGVARIVAQDVAMTAKILQLVNSSFFGMPQRIRSVSQAVSLLGLDMIKSLVLSLGIFAQYRQDQLPGFCLESMVQHSVEVGRCARQIVAGVLDDKLMSDDAQLAGMLHDVGKLVLVSEMSQLYADVIRRSDDRKLPLWRSEREAFGLSHAEIGGYLLGRWGLPNSIVEAIAFHHEPSAAGCTTFSALTAVYLADRYVHRQSTSRMPAETADIETDYLEQLGIADRLRAWLPSSK